MGIIFFKTSLEASWEKYTRETGHRFYEFSHLILLILVYEVLAFFAFSPEVDKYGQDDIWFWFFHQYFPGARWLIALGLIFYFGQYLYLDWTGKWDREESKKVRSNNNKKPPRKQPWKEKTNWYYWVMMMVEGFVYGALIFLFLRYVVFFLLDTLLGTAAYSIPLDHNGVLRHYQSNPLQDLAFSIGSGFYEEVIFRLFIFVLLLWLTKQFKLSLFQKPQTQSFKFNYSEFKIPKFNSKDSGSFTMILVSAGIYSVSHHILPFSDFFGTYPILYRFFFGLIMYRIFIWRKLSTVVWTHVMYNLLYFITA